ncbi:amidase [Nonomuraea sp. NPDC050478]|uniref:amidase n=1 Tax=Nonomuraea sp. NPDC050478 TaxID=3364365 RepID=UPI0037A9B2F3
MVRSALGLAEGLRAGETTAVDVVREAIERVRWAGERFGGVAAVDAGWSMAEAERADRRLRAGEGGVLEGVPVTVKDWIDVSGWPVSGAAGGTSGSPGRRPERDATAVARLRAAGAVVVAISSAMADNPVHGKTGNPRDPGRAPGGSSSGTAALVAAGAVPLGLGSDSGGSVRLPAAWCGVAGLKPTFGRVPLTGHFPRCGSLEDGRTVIGPIAGTVADLAATLEVIAGPDGMDGGTPPVPLADPGAVRVPGLRVATMAGAGGHEATARAVRTLAEAGAAVAERPLPDVREEALELTRRYWDRAGLSGEENVRVLWDWDRFRRRMLAATARADVLVIPAAEEPPPWRESETDDYLWTLPWSLTGAPVVVVPCGGSAVQVVGRPWEEHVVLAAAAEIERAEAPG